MSNFTPEQREAIFILGCNMVVSAGAGAGKTRVLVERYLNLITNKEAGAKEILAITFTNKAAKEMKQRILNKVSERLAAEDVIDKKYWFQIKQELNYAHIATIHSICTRILKENPVEAVLDPTFAVLDGVEDSLLLYDIAGKVVDQALKDNTVWIDKLMMEYGKDKLIKAVTDFYHSFAELWLVSDNPLDSLTKPYLTNISRIPELKSQLKQACMDLMNVKTELGPKTAQRKKIQDICDNWTVIERAIDCYDLTEDTTAQTIVNNYLGVLRKGAKDQEIVEEIKSLIEKLELIEIDKKAALMIPYLFSYFEAVHKEVEAEKNRRHAINFSDLELRTLNLLKNNREVCSRYVKKFKQIMVDEFQDTNDLQRQIIYLLAGADKDNLYGNKLFIVGDAKQSIYRFRGADVSVFERVTNDILARDGKYIELYKNFRSVKGLLDLFNDIFAVLMGTKLDNSVKFAPLLHFRTENHDGPCASLLVTDKLEMSSEEARRVEAAAIADKINALIKEPGSLLSRERRLGYGDFAILFRSTTNQEIYEAALQKANIPFYVLGGKGFFGQQEIVDVLNLLRVLENCHNQPALVGLLRSPFFSLSDETLVWMKIYGEESIWQGLSNWEKIKELSEEEQKAAENAYKILAELRQLRGSVCITDLLDKAFECTLYKQFLLSQFMGMQKYANVEKFENLAREFQAKAFYTLGDFLRYLDILLTQDVNEGEAQIESESGNTVKLMTIHKSKGLEFPVVIIPDLHRGINTANYGPLIYDQSLGLGLKVHDDDLDSLVETTVYKEIQVQDKILNALELKRLLYVAMTRAEDYLILSCVKEQEKPSKTPGKREANDKDFINMDSWAKWLGKLTLQESLIALEKTEPTEKQIAAAALINFENSRTDSDQSFIQNIIEHVNPLAIYESGNIASFSPTSLKNYRDCPRCYFYKYIAGLPEGDVENEGSSKTSIPARLVGLAVHRACEILHLYSDINECVQQAVEDKIPSEYQKAVYDETCILMSKYIKTHFYQEFKGLKSESEVRFTVNFDAGFVEGGRITFEGSIDCVIFYPDNTLGIIDYKTDNISGYEEAKQKANEYSWQLFLYSLAAEKLYKRKVRNTKLYFVRQDVAVDYLIDSNALKDVTQEILAVCEFIFKHTKEQDYERNINWCVYCGYTFCCR